jgi:outer membrane protein assembly factor BamB
MVEGRIIGQNGLIGPGGSMSFDGALQSQNPNQGYFPAVADDGTIYTASDSGLLYAVNPTQPGVTLDEELRLVNGLKWTIMLGRCQTPPTIGTDGTIYVAALDSYLYAVNPNGTLKWKFKAGQELESTPALSADGLVVYSGSDDNNLYAINTATGTLKWKYKASDDVNGAPAVDAAGNIYITTSNWNAWSINKNGKLNWKVPLRSHGSTWAFNYSDPAIDESNGTVYVGGFDGLFAYSFAGALKWKYSTGARVDAHPAVAADGLVYFTAANNTLYAVQPNGTLQWSAPASGAPFLGSDGTLYSGWHAFKDGGVGRPSVRWLEDTPDPVAPEGDLLLRARDLFDNGTIASVSYYRDANGNNQLDVGTDELVATNTDGSNFWGAVVAAPATPATYTYFAQAIDNDGFFSNVVKKTNTVASPLMAVANAENAVNSTLPTNAVKPILDEALRRWQASGVDTPSADQIDLRIADLGRATLGLASGNTIWLDDDAAGWGWFVDRTPRDDREFYRPGDQGEQGHMDLLTVLIHELGHVMGYEHSGDGVMAESLTASTRDLGEEFMDPHSKPVGNPTQKSTPVEDRVSLVTHSANWWRKNRSD